MNPHIETLKRQLALAVTEAALRQAHDHISKGRSWNSPDSLLAEIAAKDARIAELEAKLKTAVDGLKRIARHKITGAANGMIIYGRSQDGIIAQETLNQINQINQPNQ